MESGSAIVSLVWVLTALSVIIVAARGVMKILRFHGLACEDYLMIISMVNSISLSIDSHQLTTILNRFSQWFMDRRPL